jgi:hypothetical protein
MSSRVKMHFRYHRNFRQLLRLRPRDPHQPLRLPLPAQRLPADRHLCRHVLGLLSHPNRRRPGQDRPPRHPLSRHHQHLQQRHVGAHRNISCFPKYARLEMCALIHFQGSNSGCESGDGA